MLATKPTVKIYVRSPQNELLSEICAGIEEEGLFYEIIPYQEPDTQTEENSVTLSFAASRDSMLGSGLGMIKDFCSLSIYAAGKNALVEKISRELLLNRDDISDFRAAYRGMGCDAARIVKRMPLRLTGCPSDQERS